MKRLVVDIDDTLSYTVAGDYRNAKPNADLIKKLVEYQDLGFEIVLFSSRNMRTYEGSLGKINKNTLPVLIDWLEENNVPFDEVIMGKPWCGFEGFYIDDKAIRPDEFLDLSYEQIKKIVSKE